MNLSARVEVLALEHFLLVFNAVSESLEAGDRVLDTLGLSITALYHCDALVIHEDLYSISGLRWRVIERELAVHFNSSSNLGHLERGSLWLRLIAILRGPRHNDHVPQGNVSPEADNLLVRVQSEW